MPEQRPTVDAYPLELLDEQVRELRRTSRDALREAALRTRSVAARRLLAHAAAGRGATPQELVELARSGARTAALDPWALGELARVLASQDLQPDDLTDALELLDFLLATVGARRVAAEHQGFHAQLTFHLGQRERTRALLRRYPRVPPQIAANLRLDLANPYAGGTAEPAAWLRSFRKLLPAPGVTVADGPGPAIDRLGAVARRVGVDRRITSIVTTFRPDNALVAAVRSLAAQSWHDHEILVVDDGSPPEYDAVLRQCLALDSRVRLLKLLTNGGTYVARNAALDAATGEFVTFQDSDDWSHPLRLERQVGPLLADDALFATTTVGMRVTPELVVSRLGFEQHRSYNLSSVMYRREVALRRLGYLDTVRKGADAEYVERARAVFGRAAVRHLSGPPYALIRLSTQSLSAADYRLGWMHPARHAYLSAFQAWHRRVAVGDSDPRLARRPGRRRFAAPRRLSGAGPAPHYDVVLADDWTSAGSGAGAGAVGRIRALTGRGLRVALLHLDDLRNVADGRRNFDADVQELINDGVADQVVLTDGATAALLLVLSPAVLLFPPSLPSGIRPAQVIIETGHTAPAAPPVCAAAAQHLFGVEPLWAPPDASVRARLTGHPDSPALCPVDLPYTVDVEHAVADQRSRRIGSPVVGRHLDDGQTDPRTLRRTLRGTADLDLRVRAGSGVAVPPAGKGSPANWLVYDGDDVSRRAFLRQLDFYAHFPDTAPTGQPAILQAMGAGCVAVLPHRYASVFRDAAVYCAAADLADVVWRYHASADEFQAQRERGRAYVRAHHHHERYAERVAALIAGGPADTGPNGGRHGAEPHVGTRSVSL